MFPLGNTVAGADWVRSPQEPGPPNAFLTRRWAGPRPMRDDDEEDDPATAGLPADWEARAAALLALPAATPPPRHRPTRNDDEEDEEEGPATRAARIGAAGAEEQHRREVAAARAFIEAAIARDAARMADFGARARAAADEHRRREAADRVDCSADLELFHQYERQCWSDSAAVLLLFAQDFGQDTQTVLRNDIHTLGSYYNHFKGSPYTPRGSAPVGIRNLVKASAYPEISEEDITSIIDNLFMYILSLKERFENRRQQLRLGAAGPVPGPARLLRSQICSLKQEQYGIIVSELFRRRNAERNQVLRPGKRLNLLESEYGGQNRLRAGEKLIEGFGGGYSPSRFGKTMVLFLLFTNFISGNRINYYTINPGLSLRDFDFGERSIVICQNDVNYHENMNQIESIDLLRAIPLSVPLSTCVNIVYRNVADLRPVSGHIISFIECGNTQYIYDNNQSRLVRMDWRFIFSESFDHLLYVHTARYERWGIICYNSTTGNRVDITSDNQFIRRPTGARHTIRDIFAFIQAHMPEFSVATIQQFSIWLMGRTRPGVFRYPVPVDEPPRGHGGRRKLRKSKKSKKTQRKTRKAYRK
jgi:hypothetical protein